MLALRRSGRFKKDFRRIQRRGYDLAALRSVIDLICRNEALPARCRPHALKSEWSGYHECHVGPDWLLIYRVAEKEVLLAATGTHSDLFGE